MSSANLALKIKEHEDRLSRIERIVEANALAIEKLHQEMLAFKEGMGEFKDWCKGQIREMNKQWGNLANKKITLIFVSLYIDEKFVDLLTEAGIYAMAYREWEYMDILNFDELSRLEDPRS